MDIKLMPNLPFSYILFQSEIKEYILHYCSLVEAAYTLKHDQIKHLFELFVQNVLL